MPDNDPVATLLRKQPLTNEQRAQLWDAFESAADPDDLASRLATLKAPDSLKADLWDLKDSASAAVAQMTPDFTTKTVADPSLLEQAGRAYLDTNIGALKGIGQTVTNLARAPYLIPGAKGAIERLYGFEPGSVDALFTDIDRRLQPQGTVQSLSKAGEQIAETLLPGRLVTKAGLALGAKAPQGLQTIVRMAAEGAGGAGMAAVQGNDPTTAGGMAAALVPAGKVAGKVAGAVSSRVAPAMREAVAFAERRGVPVDAATATGSRLMRGVQDVIGRGTIAGGFVRDHAEDAREAGLTRVARELADEAHPSAVVPEQAGASLREGVKAKVREFYNEANDAYGRLREIAARPENAALVPKGGRVAEVADEVASDAMDTAMFAGKGSGDLWRDVLMDAKRNGFKGSPTELRRLFDERQRAASDLLDVMNQGNEGNRFLQFVAKQGGIGRAEKDLQGEVDRLWEMTRAPRPGQGSSMASASSMRRQTGALGGVDGVMNRNGLSVDQMVERIRSSGEFGDFSDVPDSALFELVEDAVRMADDTKMSAFDALAQTGVRPGVKWWQTADEAADDGLESMALPVDMRPAKEGLRDLYDTMKRQMPVFQQQASPGLKALQNIIEGPDFSPATIADADLGAIKKLARGAEMPELRSLGQGTAAQAVGQLEDAVQAAVRGAGPEAMAARDAGRAATRAKASAADVLKAIRKEPVEAFNQAVYANDSGIDRLREVAKLAPQEMPKVGRAYLEKLFAQATEQGGFGREAGLFRAWHNLGPETKKILYPNPMLRRDLDAFFQLAVKSAENSNKSGSGFTAALGAQGLYAVMDPVSGAMLQVPAYAMAKLLYSPKGVRLLTQGLKLPSLDKATAANVFQQLQRLVQQAEQTTPAVVRQSRPAETRTGAAR